MAHYAKVENGIVTQVIVISNEDEADAEKFISEKLKLDGVWLKTSYNTKGNQHLLGGIPFRKNYAGIGFSYDAELDAFIPPKTYDSWILNSETGLWDPPIPFPSDGGKYFWDESIVNWVEVQGE